MSDSEKMKSECWNRSANARAGPAPRSFSTSSTPSGVASSAGAVFAATRTRCGPAAAAARSAAPSATSRPATGARAASRCSSSAPPASARRGEPSTISAAATLVPSFSAKFGRLSAAHVGTAVRDGARGATVCRGGCRKATRSSGSEIATIVAQLSSGARLRTLVASAMIPHALLASLLLASSDAFAVPHAPCRSSVTRPVLALRVTPVGAQLGVRQRRNAVLLSSRLVMLSDPVATFPIWQRLRTRVLGVADSVANFGFYVAACVYCTIILAFLSVLEVLRSARNILEKLLHRGTSGSVAPAEPKLEV